MGKKAKVKVKVKKRKLKLKRIFFCLIFLGLLGGIFYLVKKIPITNIYIIGNNIVPDKEIISTAGIDNYPSFIDTSNIFTFIFRFSALYFNIKIFPKSP